MVALLIDSGANVDIDDYKKWTPLCVAARVSFDVLMFFFLFFSLFSKFHIYCIEKMMSLATKFSYFKKVWLH